MSPRTRDGVSAAVGHSKTEKSSRCEYRRGMHDRFGQPSRKIARALLALLLFATACGKRSDQPERTTQASAVCDVNGYDHDALFRRGADLVDPHMLLVDRKAAARNDAEVQIGIACLNRVVEINPSNWSALWIRGKAFQSLGEHRDAVESFRAAYRLNPDHPDVARELAVELLETQRFREAATIAREISNRSPQDAGLIANLALALLMSGELPAAREAIADALELDPNDPISKALAKRIDDVANGSRPQPKSLEELQRQESAP
jgi:tetratricopeptide (TPR) repeat protein